MLTVRETARRLDRDSETIRRWIRTGRLPAQRAAGVYTVAERAVRAIEDELFPMAELPDEWKLGDDRTPARNWVAALRHSRGGFQPEQRVAHDDPQTTDPDGRVVVFDAGTRLHLALGRPDLMDETDLILGVVAHPDRRAHDPLPGREHFYRQDLDPRRWLRVVVDFNDEPAWVVTALVQEKPPRGWKP